MKEEKKANSEENSEQELVHQFEGSPTKMKGSKLAVLLVVFVVLGVASGFLIAKANVAAPVTGNDIKNASQVEKGSTFGSNDTSSFKDTVEGDLKEGGIEGEGQYHLERSGGDSQNVYLTSSAVDLSLVVGRKVKVWGQTQKAQHAGWLMDVGRVEVLE